MRRLDFLKQKIAAQEFSDGLSQDVIFDISLFMLTEIHPINKDVESGNTSDSLEELEGQTAETTETVETTEAVETEGELEAIRDEVRTEVLKDVEDYDEGTDLKVARLKRIAKESPMLNKTGVRVRRSEN